MKRIGYTYILIISLISTTLGVSFVLSSSYSNAVSTSANASVTVGSACSLTATGNNSHTATISPGTYTPDIGSTTITVTCNDPGGYALYAIGYTNDTYGTTTLDGVSSGQTIATGTNTGTSGSSNWAMKLTPVSGTYAPSITTGYEAYHAVPSTYTKVASFSNPTDIGSNATGSKLTATYAVFIAGDQSADTYNGKVKYTMVHPSTESAKDGPMACSSNKICYSPNANDVIGTMGQQTASANNSYTLLASNFSRKGYGFAGWSDVYDYETNPNANFYGPQETYTTPSSMTSGKTLYAVWVESEGYFQNSTTVSTVCNRLTQSGPNVTKTLNSVSALTDQRDNETYAIAKLADGNCWMIENLRLDNTNSDNSTGALSQGYATNFIGLADPESPWAYNTTTANSLYSTDGSTSVTISGSNPYYRMPRYNNVNTPSTASDRPSNPTSNSATNSTSNAGMYSYGNYYTWTAASTDTSEASTGDYNTKSICPTGWSIPRGGNKSREATNDFWTYIVTNLNGGTNPANYDSSNQPYYSGTAEAGPVANALRNYPNNFVYSGYIDSSSVSSRGSNGDYWSSTAVSSSGAYNLRLYSSLVSPGTNSNSKSAGRSVRCIVR